MTAGRRLRAARSIGQGLRIEHADGQPVVAEVAGRDGLHLLGTHLLQFFDQPLALAVRDADRFELWLRDLLSITLGPNAAASVRVAFHELPDGEGVPRAVCQITAEASPRPVYLKPNKNSAPELWVRAGNSTRQLAVDSATEYVMHRWPLGAGANLAAQLRAAVRGTGNTE